MLDRMGAHRGTAAAPSLPSASVVRSAPVRKGQRDGPCVVSQHAVSHVDPIGILSTNLPHVRPGTRALCTEKVVGKGHHGQWGPAEQQGSASEARPVPPPAATEAHSSWEEVTR